jgi:hypothetical protein
LSSVDATGGVVVGDTHGIDFGQRPAGLVFLQVLQIFEEVFGPVKMHRAAIAPQHGGNPVRVRGHKHATHRAGVARAGCWQFDRLGVGRLTGS